MRSGLGIKPYLIPGWLLEGGARTELAWDLRGWGVGWSGASSRGERGAAEAQGAEARREEEERKGETDADRWAPSVSDGRRGCGVTRVTRKRREERAGALRGWSERVWGSREEAGAHAGQLRARRASACGLESAQERGSAGAGPAGPRAVGPQREERKGLGRAGVCLGWSLGWIRSGFSFLGWFELEIEIGR